MFNTIRLKHTVTIIAIIIAALFITASMLTLPGRQALQSISLNLRSDPVESRFLSKSKINLKHNVSLQLNFRSDNSSKYSLVPLPVSNSSRPTKYVRLCNSRIKGDHRLGNHLFMFAAMVHVARLTGRVIAVPTSGWILDETFDIQQQVQRTNDLEKLCPCTPLYTPHYDYDYRLDNDTFVRLLSESTETISICGLCQTYLYAEKVNAELRGLLTFKPSIVKYVESFKGSMMNVSKWRDSGWPDLNVSFVGVHVRRGDYMAESHAKYGLTVATAEYLKNSVETVTGDPLRSTKLIVATDDFGWVRDNFPKLDNISQTNVEMVFLRNNSASMDFAMLSSCDAVIFTTGSFGWWAAWLADGTSIYYKDCPREGSPMYAIFNRSNYFKPHWIPSL